MRKNFKRILMMVVVLVAMVVVKKIQHHRDLACREQLYQQAVAVEQNQDFRSSYRRYSFLCDVAYYKGGCDGAARLSRRFRESYVAVMAALSDYRDVHGEYPARLNAVLEQLPPPTRAVASQFTYCKKTNPSDHFKTCSDGPASFSSSDEDISISTGEFGGVTFDLHRKPPRFYTLISPRSCVLLTASTKPAE